MKPVKVSLVILSLLMGTAHAIIIRGNDGAHGGDGLMNRILLARVFAIQIVAKADESDVSGENKIKMISVLSRAPRFTGVGERLFLPDPQGRQIEVSAMYDPATMDITFNLLLCEEQRLTLADSVALYLHEAGHSVGLSKTMARRREDFLSDIGYRLVAKEIARPDSIFRQQAFLTPPGRQRMENWYWITTLGQPSVDESRVFREACRHQIDVLYPNLHCYSDKGSPWDASCLDREKLDEKATKRNLQMIPCVETVIGPKGEPESGIDWNS